MKSLSWAELAEQLFAAVNSGLMVAGADRNVAAINPAACRLLGISAEEAVGQDLFSFGQRLDGTIEDSAAYQAFQSGRTCRGVHEKWVLGERIYHFEVTADPIYDDRGAVSGVILIFADHTEQKIIQEKLMHRDRLNLLGEFAAEIVHEVSNPISTIEGALDVLETVDLQDGETLQDMTAVMRRKLHALQTLVSRILQFSRQNTVGERQHVDLVTVMDEVLLMMGQKIREAAIQIRRRSTETEAVVYGNLSEILQVFFNLMLNSVEAMPDGGTLTIDMDRNEQLFRVRIGNTGEPIPRQMLARLEEPFFTTKKQGTGLGLVVVRRIVAEHEGTFTLTSSPEQTTATVMFPAADASERSNHKHDWLSEEIF